MTICGITISKNKTHKNPILIRLHPYNMNISLYIDTHACIKQHNITSHATMFVLM